MYEARIEILRPWRSHVGYSNPWYDVTLVLLNPLYFRFGAQTFSIQHVVIVMLIRTTLTFPVLAAGIPAPIYFGAIIDTTCLKWGYKRCGGRGACRIYNTTAYRSVLSQYNRLLEVGSHCSLGMVFAFKVLVCFVGYCTWD